MIRYLLALAALCLPAAAHARPVVWGGTPCTNTTANNDGCYNGGSVQVPTFFQGYATAGSTGVTYPAATSNNPWFLNINAISSNQPVAYPVRPPWNVAGVDYAVGMPRWQMPAIGNLHPAWLKDPALVATDTLINPLGQGENCQFYTSNTATGSAGGTIPGGVGAGTTSTPFPFALGGAGIFCKAASGSSVNQLIFDAYNFSWNSSTGYGCVPLYFYQQSFGTGAAQNSPATAAIIVRNSLVVNGPNCNIWGGVGQGTGTATAGPEGSGVTHWLNLANSTSHMNTFAFMNNTVYGCGGDALATALETALCSATFPSTSYNAGSITGWASGSVGVAPFASSWINLTGGTAWVEFNAFMHMPGHLFDVLNVNVGNNIVGMYNNYVEGMLYKQEPGFYVSSIVCSANCSTASLSTPATETVTSNTAHGIPVGSYYSMVIVGQGAAGEYWAGTYTFHATDATHLTFQSVANNADWTYGGTGPYAWFYSNYTHGEWTNVAATTTGATFTGTISGNTLTVSGLTGTLTAGQYITTNGAADGVINATISGSTLTVNSTASGVVAVGQIVSAAIGSGLTIPKAVTIVAGSGSTWTLSQSIGSVGSGTVNTYDAIPAPTYITGGSGSTWTLNQSVGIVGPTPMTAPYYTPGVQGGTTTYSVAYNTYLGTPSVFGYGGTTIVWCQSNSNLMGVPLSTLVCDINHNVFVSDLQNNSQHLQTSYGVAFQATRLGAGSNLTNNYIDPTGNYYCWPGYTMDAGAAPTISGNVNLLNPADPYINVMDAYPVIPYYSGSGTNTQGENGLSYNTTTGVLTITLSAPATFGAGQKFQIRNGLVNTGTNYLGGTLTATSVSGSTVTANVGTGYPGVPTSVTAGVVLIDGSGQLEACYGHN